LFNTAANKRLGSGGSSRHTESGRLKAGHLAARSTW
jgi:hypothetical protein